jgi:hypothetical protein
MCQTSNIFENQVAVQIGFMKKIRAHYTQGKYESIQFRTAFPSVTGKCNDLLT